MPVPKDSAAEWRGELAHLPHLGKESLGDVDWTPIDAATTAGYNFFNVTVEME